MSRGELSIIEGATAQSVIDRWGDYSSLNLDPSDGCTFRYTNEYLEPLELEDGTVTGVWQTRIARFRFDACQSRHPVEVSAIAPRP